MAEPSARVRRAVRRAFAAGDVEVVLRLLQQVPEELGCDQDAERVQASLVLPAGGDLERFWSLVDLARTDWRDALVGAGLGDADWPTRLDEALGSR